MLCKVLDEACRRQGTFALREVTAIFEHARIGLGQMVVKELEGTGWQEAITLSPQQRGWRRHLAQFVSVQEVRFIGCTDEIAHHLPRKEIDHAARAEFPDRRRNCAEDHPRHLPRLMRIGWR